jgi:hypothetical protein
MTRKIIDFADRFKSGKQNRKNIGFADLLKRGKQNCTIIGCADPAEHAIAHNAIG